jgi:THO complex subunit 2
MHAGLTSTHRSLPPATQVESYDNMIDVSLDALKYLSPLSYDVLTFVILQQ